MGDLDGIAVTCGPGLLGALLVGVSAAKGYALATGLPLVGVHHIAGHVAAACLANDVSFPALALVVSGGIRKSLRWMRYFVSPNSEEPKTTRPGKRTTRWLVWSG
ncbi:hypothetical protein GCM10025857_17360 [Alicyclobacillus contaminans]|nr:hypothetical protein GCM10025857_17360 [Alicyclobacillus contaminans]